MTQPLLPAGAFKILVVCTGNICRSPMAECLLRDALDHRVRLNPSIEVASAERTSIEVASAGTHGYDNAPMDPNAAEQLRRLGGDPSEFRSRPLTDQLSEQADLILTATRRHRSFVLERVPQALRQTFTLLEFADAIAIVRRDQPEVSDLPEIVRLAAAARSRVGLQDYDIADPYGAPPDAHRLVADVIQAAVTSIAEGLRPGRRH